MQNDENVWSNPEQGLLGGKIIEIDGNTLRIEDFVGQIWQVDIEGAKVPFHVEIEVGEKYKFVGQKIDNISFTALGIRPWEMGPFGKGWGFDPNYSKVKGRWDERRPF